MKGQYFSFDAIIASVIFVLALVALLSYWHSVRSFLDFQNDAMAKEAVRVSNLLFSVPVPSSNCADISSLGFAKSSSDKRLDSSLIACAQKQDQEWLKKTLGTSYGVKVEVTEIGSGVGKSSKLVTLIGNEPPSDKTNVAVMRRLATVVNSKGETTIATVDISLYS